MLTFQEVKKNEAIRTYIQRADESLIALGYTEHSFAHVTMTAEMAGNILETLGYPARTVELAKIAGFLHDIGNLVNRVDHSQSGAVMAFRILDNLKVILEQYGSDMDHVVRIDVILAKWSDKTAMNAEYVKHFKREKLPARVCYGDVAIAGDCKVEMVVIATKK